MLTVSMDFEAAIDELRTTPVREFARARMQEIYDIIGNTVPQAHGDAPEHSQIHFSATRHSVHMFIAMFSTLAKMTLNDGISDDNVSNEDLADLYYKCRCIHRELRTKQHGSPVAAAERNMG